MGRRLPGLDVLRGIAALWVLWFHIATILFDRDLPAGKGYLAVDFFFMLSGYVMARTYEHRFAAGYKASAFLWARYRRLWPVMAIGILIGLPMLALEVPNKTLVLAAAIANLMLIPAFKSAILYPSNSAAWSIFVELSANFAHGLGLKRLRVRGLLVFAALAAAVLVWTCLTHGSLDTGAGYDTLAGGMARAMYAYTIGIVLWRIWRDDPPFRIPAWMAFAAIPALLLGVELLGITGWWFDMAFVLLVCPLLLAGGLDMRTESRTAWWLGAISFPLYAVNLPLLHWTKGLGLNPLSGIGLALILSAYIAARTAPRLRRGKTEEMQAA